MIEFENVSKEYSGKPALRNISFRIDAGTACGYIGPNGAGKTSTAKIIVGLQEVSSGRVHLLNEEGFDGEKKARNQIGYVPESPKLYESLTPTETITMSSLLRKFDVKEAGQRLELLSEIFAFEEYLKKPIQGLSKGTRQKIVISLALIFKPRLLVLDEPTDGLDVQAVVNLKRLIKSFTNHGGTVFYSSHLLDIVETVCDKVYFIAQGRITAEYLSCDFNGKRGFLEEVFMDQAEVRSELADSFFENGI